MLKLLKIKDKKHRQYCRRVMVQIKLVVWNLKIIFIWHKVHLGSMVKLEKSVAEQ